MVPSEAFEQRKLLRKISEFLDNQKLEQEGQWSSEMKFQEYSSQVEEAMTLLYPSGYPPNEPFKIYLDQVNRKNEELITMDQNKLFNLWFCGKKMDLNQDIGHFTKGKDECKLVISVTSPGSESKPTRSGYSKEDQEKLYHV